MAGVRAVATDTVEAAVQTSSLNDVGVRGSGVKGAGQFSNGQGTQFAGALNAPEKYGDQLMFHEQSASGIAVAMTDVSQALEGEEKEAGVDKNPAALADLVEKPAAILATAVQAGQLLSPAKTGRVFVGKAVTAHLETADTQNSDVQAMQKSNGRDWTVVNRSPNKQNYPVSKNQFASKNVGHDLASTSWLFKPPGSGKHQQSMKNAEAGSKFSNDLALVPVDEQKAGAVPNAASPDLLLSNPDLDKMVKDAQAAMEMA
ncbi:hypothetical protein A4A49_07373 [Nicotiana attenuata]|uniref:Uncharacterized protein n=1 Tax=Nicotiana attenuata TaxID=49451 RepID=A0A1J6HX10_NICAT|nr:hypothetical protein A4A49_07373 [Nicotiana attenuata]